MGLTNHHVVRTDRPRQRITSRYCNHRIEAVRTRLGVDRRLRRVEGVRGDYSEIAITNAGKTIAVWGEGFSWTGPGGAWFNRET